MWTNMKYMKFDLMNKIFMIFIKIIYDVYVLDQLLFVYNNINSLKNCSLISLISLLNANIK